MMNVCFRYGFVSHIYCMFIGLTKFLQTTSLQLHRHRLHGTMETTAATAKNCEVDAPIFAHAGIRRHK